MNMAFSVICVVILLASSTGNAAPRKSQQREQAQIAQQKDDRDTQSFRYQYEVDTSDADSSLAAQFRQEKSTTNKIGGGGTKGGSNQQQQSPISQSSSPPSSSLAPLLLSPFGYRKRAGDQQQFRLVQDHELDQGFAGFTREQQQSRHKSSPPPTTNGQQSAAQIAAQMAAGSADSSTLAPLILEPIAQLKDSSPQYETVTSTSVSTSSRSSPLMIKSRSERKNQDLNRKERERERQERLERQEQERQQRQTAAAMALDDVDAIRLEQFKEDMQAELQQQKKEPLIQQITEKQMTEQLVMTTAAPVKASSMTQHHLNQGREIEGGHRAAQSESVQPMPALPKASTKTVHSAADRTRKQIANKISIHQLISESMPSLQMSVVPVYFVNKVTKNVMAIPYLVMKSVSKMPLLPGMFEGLNGLSGMVGQNLLNFQHHRVQRSNSFRSGSNLLPLLAHHDRQTAQLQSLLGVGGLGSQSPPAERSKIDENDLDTELESERDVGPGGAATGGAGGSDWVPMGGENDSQSPIEQSTAWWRK